MLPHEQKEAAMPKGVYRDTGGWVHVNYEDKYQMPMHRSDYEEHDYKPAFESLPTKEKYDKSKTLRKPN